MWPKVLTIAGIIACSATGLLRGQGGSPLAVGTRVRVVVPDSTGTSPQYLEGRLARLSGDTVVLWSGGGLVRAESLTVILEHGRRLEVEQSGHSQGGRGAGLGALAGAFAGGIIGLATYKECTPSGLSCLGDMGQGGQAAGGAFVGAGVGALIGYLIGSSMRVATWAPVETTGIQVALLPRGFAVRLRI